MALSADDDTQMSSIIAAMRSQLMDGYTNLAASTGTGFLTWLSDSTASSQAQQGNLNQYAAKIDALDGPDRASVRNGYLTLDAWKASAQTTSAGIAAVAGYDIGWSNLWHDVVGKTATDVEDLAHKGLDALPDASSLPWYLVAGIAVLVLILLIKVT